MDFHLDEKLSWNFFIFANIVNLYNKNEYIYQLNIKINISVYTESAPSLLPAILHFWGEGSDASFFRASAYHLTDCARLVTKEDIAENASGINCFLEKLLSLLSIEADKNHVD